jgi:hypothetical protein
MTSLTGAPNGGGASTRVQSAVAEAGPGVRPERVVADRRRARLSAPSGRAGHPAWLGRRAPETSAAAPCYVVPANNKWYRNLDIAGTTADSLEAMNLHYPAAEAGLDKA